MERVLRSSSRREVFLFASALDDKNLAVVMVIGDDDVGRPLLAALIPTMQINPPAPPIAALLPTAKTPGVTATSKVGDDIEDARVQKSVDAWLRARGISPSGGTITIAGLDTPRAASSWSSRRAGTPRSTSSSITRATPWSTRPDERAN
jgi:hypothetical protein